MSSEDINTDLPTVTPNASTRAVVTQAGAGAIVNYDDRYVPRSGGDFDPGAKVTAPVLGTTVAVELAGNLPLLVWYDEDGTPNARRVDAELDDGTWTLYASDDDGSNRRVALTVDADTGAVTALNVDALTAAGPVTVPDATADGQALAYDQANWRLVSGI